MKQHCNMYEAINPKNLFDVLKSCKKHKANLVAVTKYATIDATLNLIKNGVTSIGENYIQKAEEKFSAFSIGCKKHFIGHLQTNKVKKAVELFDSIDTVGSEKLYKKIVKEAEIQNKKVKILFQINITDESQKSGFSINEFENFISQFKKDSLVSSEGIMIIGKSNSTEIEIRNVFREAKKLSLKYNSIIGGELSMGMSGDYTVALEEGATMIRVGRVLFE